MRSFSSFSLLPSLLVLLAGALLLAGCDSNGGGESEELGDAPLFSFTSADAGTVAEDAGGTYEMTVMVSDPGHQSLSVDVVFDEEASDVAFSELSGIERTNTLTFPESTTDSTSQTLTFSVADDDEIGEMGEGVVFALANPQPEQSAIGANGTFSLTVEDDDLETIDIAEALDRADGETVAVEGVVTRVEGSNVRIQDGTAGIVVRYDALASAIESGDVSIGDRIRASGPLGTFNGLRQLDDGSDAGSVSYTVLEEDAGLPEPQDVALGDLGDDLESELVTVDGLSFQTDEETFASDGGDGFGNYTVTDEDGTEGVVRIPEGSFYVDKSIPSSSFTFTGVVGERNGTYKLVAINEGDITTTGPEITPIAEARETEGTPVTIEGIITSVGAEDARIQDETAGIFISRNEGFAGDVARGDRVRLTGSVSSYANQKQIDSGDLTSYTVLSNDNALPEAQTLSSLTELGDAVESERVRIEGVTISPDGGDDDSDPDGAFIAGGAEGNYTITDSEGNTAFLRIPDVSFYDGEEIPSGEVSIEAVAGQFFDDDQILARYDGEIMATGDGGGEPATLLSENFDDETLDPFTQFSVSSNANWEIGSFDGATFARVSGFDADEDSNDWLISPALDFSATSNEKLAFTTVKGYDGPELNVLVSTDYSGSGNPEDATWTDITDRATLAQNSDKPEGENFTPFISSGEVDVSDFDGSEVYIAFQYTSTPDNAATWEVDDVVVAEESATGGDGFPTPPDRP